MKKIISHVGRHPFAATIWISIILGYFLAFLVLLENLLKHIMAFREMTISFLTSGIFVGAIALYPFVLIAGEVIIFLCGFWKPEIWKKGKLFDLVGVILGWLYANVLMELGMQVVKKDWTETLINNQIHTPLHTELSWIFWVIIVLGVIGWFIVNSRKVNNTPPLTFVLGLALMYLATTIALVWGIQVFRLDKTATFFLELVPFHYLLFTARTVLTKMYEWKTVDLSNRTFSRFPWLQKVNEWLVTANSWPWVAFLLMWPLLGIFMGVLVLLGQEPDAVIKMFTETSEWNLSQRVSPQNIRQDEHYLCTVAAGGHEKIVKPKRLGVRHGHEVIVNRQLCIANAFEQILEEKTPRFHKAVRHFYDTYGFPVAKLIHSKTVADVVYFVMKPLEWLFLIVLYFTDVNPENRIAIQYTGKNLKDFQGTQQ